jgi:predicted ATPase
MSLINNGFLIKIELISSNPLFPFNIPAIKSINNLTFNPNITFLTGENGSGKSTIIESIAKLLKLNPEGGNKHHGFNILNSESELCHHIRLVKTTRVIKDSFFLRSETGSNLLIAAENDIKEDPQWAWGHSYKMLKQRSHGEFTMDLIESRMSCGVYLMDEPESGLSIQKQFEFLARLDELVKNGSQLIIASHSPIILSHPNSTIYELSDNGIQEINYEKTSAYQLTKRFVNNHKILLKEIGI